MNKHHTHIYISRAHLLATILLVLGPFLFLLLFSRFAKIATGDLFRDVFVSAWRLAVAYSISATCAWIAATAFYRGTRAAIALPIFDVLQSFPTFALLPLAVRAFGASNFTVISFLIVTIVWPIFFSLIGSLKLIQRDWEEAVEISGLRGFRYLALFLWPVSVPGLITGTIIGLGEGWEALVATEIITKTPMGLGNFFERFSTNPSVTAFGILGLLFLIFSINKLVWLPLLERTHEMMEG
jgi:NitT/TauT family transport system permease protein